ncbi:hypothetical protein ACWOB3_03935 [Enterococcus songbeiensis]
MLNKIPNVFGKDFVRESSFLIYNIFKLSLYFSLFSFPWFLINLTVIIKLDTLILYAIFGSLLIPNLMTLFEILHGNNLVKDEVIGVKIYFNMWRKNFREGIFEGVIFSGVCLLFLYELTIIAGYTQLQILFPIFSVLLIGLCSMEIYLVLLKSCYFSERRWIELSKITFFLGWKNIFKSICIFSLLLIWGTIGYLLPILNIFLGNLIIFGAIFYIGNKDLAKLITN